MRIPPPGWRGHNEALRRARNNSIGVSYVSPGFVATEMTDGQAVKDRMEGPNIVAAALVRLVKTGPRRHVVVRDCDFIARRLARRLAKTNEILSPSKPQARAQQ